MKEYLLFVEQLTNREYLRLQFCEKFRYISKRYNININVNVNVNVNINVEISKRVKVM